MNAEEKLQQLVRAAMEYAEPETLYQALESLVGIEKILYMVAGTLDNPDYGSWRLPHAIVRTVAYELTYHS